MQQAVQTLLARYPKPAQVMLSDVQLLIHTVAKDRALGDVNTSIKWCQASFSVKTGSPIRIGWSEKSPNTVSLYFHCQTLLISTFREIYPDELHFVGNREIRLAIDEPLPENVLKHCIEMALMYHTIKHRPLLGN